MNERKISGVRGIGGGRKGEKREVPGTKLEQIIFHIFVIM